MASRRNIDELQQIMAHRIRMLRKAAGLTQEQLAEKVDIAPQYLSRLETARRLPSLDTIVDLAKSLNTTPSALLAEPQHEPHAERMTRVAAMFSALPEEDAAFLESQLAGWMQHVRRHRR